MRPFKAVLATALLAGTAGIAPAIPYASGIGVGTTIVGEGSGTSISYTLNHAADTVAIDILDSLDAVVASFAGTTAAGVNTINWDGTDNNSGGTALAADTGYRVRVSVTGNEAAGWVRYKANGSPTSAPILDASDVISDWWPKGLTVNNDPDSDFFGSVMVGFGYFSLQPSAAVMEFRSDLSIKAGGNGFATRVMRHPGDDEVLPNPGSYTVWGLSWDPDDSNRLWYTGQATSSSNTGAPEYLKGDGVNGALPQFATSADPTNVIANGLFPRGLKIHNIGGQRYGFVTYGNANIIVVTISASNEFETNIGNILSTTGWTNADTRYSKDVRFDSDGNLYWGSQRINTTSGSENGRVYRWSAAQVAAAIADPIGAPLTEASAQWIITNDHAAVNQRVAGFAINPVTDDVYVIAPNQGMFLVGNTSAASLTVGLSSLTALIPNTEFRSLTLNINGGTSDFWFDAVGNLIACDGSGENVMAFSPGGAASNAFTAPPSQSFDVVEVTSGSTNWTLYH